MMVQRFNRRHSLRFWIASTAIVVLLVARLAWNARKPAEVESLTELVYQVRRVVDGDTLLLTNRSRIRLIGVDTPEMNSSNPSSRASAVAAKGFTEDFVRGGRISLQFDRERVDRFGRFLAYVYVDEEMLNEQLIRRGHGRAMLSRQWKYSDSRRRVFRQAQEEAQAAGRGIWRTNRQEDSG